MGQTDLCAVTRGTLHLCLGQAWSKGLPCSSLNPGHIALIPVGQAGKPELASLGCLAEVAWLVRDVWDLRLSPLCTEMSQLHSLHS